MGTKLDMQACARHRQRCFAIDPQTKLAFIEWLNEKRSMWAKCCNHDGELNSPERNVSFDQYLELPNKEK